jgi:molecular chaperone DnaK
MGKVVGIDLGTTNSCVAISDGKRTTVIPNKGGYKTTPSVVAFLENDQRLVGQVAKRQAITNPTNTVYSAKRLIGRRIQSVEAKVAKALYPYELAEGPHGDIRIRCRDKEYSLSEISSFVLAEMRRVAEDFLDEPVRDAVVTVPAYFNDGQRQATKDAGKIAGLNVIRIINEPTAAAIAYGYNRKDDKRVAVYDLGGGTFDISILEITQGVFKVIATSGDTFLGGDDIDNLLVDFVADRFVQEAGVDLRQNKSSLQRLKDACEKAKCDLSQYREVALSLPFIETGPEGPLHLNVTLDRKILEELVRPLVEKTVAITAECLRMARMEKSDLDDVILVGGQTRTPFVQDTVSNFFGRSAARQVHPDEAVAVGAAIQAHALTAAEEVKMLLLDVTPLPLGIQSSGGSFTRLIEANTTVPVSRTRVFTTVAENQETVRIQVFQGDKPVADENELLGEFLLAGIRPAPAAEPEIEVKFDIDANGIVQVSAKDLETGQQQSITVTMSSGLTADEVERMRKKAAAEGVAVKDQEDSERLAQKAEVLAHRLRKTLESKASGIPAARVTTFRKLLDAAPGFIRQRDPRNLDRLIEQLELVLKEFP